MKGQTKLEIDLGPVKTSHNVIVAEIKSQAILGMEFWTAQKCTLDLNKCCIRIENTQVPMWNEFSAEPNCCRLTVADHVTVPGNHEQLIQAKFMKRGSENRFNVIEGSSLFQLKYGVLVARTLTGITSQNAVVRVLNPTDDDIDLKQGTTIGTCYPINSSSVQKLNTVLVNSLDHGEKRPDVKISDLPEPLQKFTENSSEHLNNSDKQKFMNLLYQYRDVFVDTGGKLGRTGIVKH